MCFLPRLVAWLAALLVLSALDVQHSAAGHACIHGSRKERLITGVRIGEKAVVKREARQPMRFFTHLDVTITAILPDTKRQTILDEVIPSLLDYLSETLSVSPLSQPVLLDSQCSPEGFYLTPGGRQCVETCQPTICGTVRVPNEHLKACVECRGRGSGGECSPSNPAKDGQGVPSTDFVLYISANQSQCPKDSEATVLAFASACQLEASQDRPIAGYINFCPTALKDTNNAYVYSVAKHEMLHALAFSSQLFPYWRHQNGEPRTLRSSSGEPPIDDSDSPVADSSTVKTLTYNSWRTAGRGPVQHTIIALATEAILREGRAHFGYPELQGVELENQGGDGTALQHWEKRLLGNEAMTGVFTFDPVFSRLSLAVMEDSGWYSVNYSSASPLLWGRGKGWSFVEEGCGNLVEDTHDESNPFCGVHESSNRLGCTLGRGAVAQCNRVTFTSQLHPGFQYFEGAPRDGGELQVTDFCPMYRAFTYQSGAGTNCSDPANQQVTRENVRGEKYGSGSRCVGQGREWKTISGGFVYSSSQFGGGCYEYECSEGGVTVFVKGVPFKCSCEGEEHIVDLSWGSESCVTGSIICPSCSSICYDDHPISVCPHPEPEECYGRVVGREGDCSRRVGSTRHVVGGASTTPLVSHVSLVLITIFLLLMTN